MTQGVTEFDLIALAQAGDQAALGRLLVMHEPRLARHLTVQIPNSATAMLAPADVVQQTFIEAFRDFSQFEYRGPGSLFAWLKTIAGNRLSNAIRKLKAQKRGGEFRRVETAPEASTDLIHELAGEAATASLNVSRQEAWRAVRAALAALPEDQRNVIQFRYLEGKSIVETAAAMSRTPAAVRGLADRAKAQLRDLLGRISIYLSVQ